MNRKELYREHNGYPANIGSETCTYVNRCACTEIYECGGFKYRRVADYLKWPEELWGYMISGVAVDRHDNIYVSQRCKEAPICVFDKDGNFIKTIGSEVKFSRPHGIYVAPDDTIWFTDDALSVIWHIDGDGNELDMLGTYGVGSDTGYDFFYVDPSDKTEPTNFMYVNEKGENVRAQVKNSAYLSIKRMGPPFNKPTKLVMAKDGRLVVSDGYGNVAVHVFTPDYKLIRSWGGPGKERGHFSIPHGVWVDKYDRAWVCDRENERMQVFDLEGHVLKIMECNFMPFDAWADDEYCYVLEGDGRISIFNLETYELVSQIGYWHCQDMIAHAMAGNSKGDLFCADLGIKGVFKLERIREEAEK